MVRSLRTTSALLCAALITVAASAGIYRAITPLKATATAFDPTQLTGKIALFIADAGNVTLSGSDVTSWNDVSGNGHNATGGGVSASLPQFNASGLNGQGTITFQSSGNNSFDFTLTNLFQSGRGVAVYTVLKHNLAHSENIFFTGTLGAGTDFPVLEYNSAQGGGVYLLTGTPGVITPASWPASPGSAWHIVDYTYNGSGYLVPTNSSLYFDRSQITTSVLVTYADQGTTNNAIGNYQAAGATAFAFTGDMAAMIILDHELTGTERTNLNDWVATKYGF